MRILSHRTYHRNFKFLLFFMTIIIIILMSLVHFFFCGDIGLLLIVDSTMHVLKHTGQFVKIT